MIYNFPLYVTFEFTYNCSNLKIVHSLACIFLSRCNVRIPLQQFLYAQSTAFELFSDQNIGKRILLYIKERENSCVEPKGGHFENILKLKDHENEE